MTQHEAYVSIRVRLLEMGKYPRKIIESCMSVAAEESVLRDAAWRCWVDYCDSKRWSVFTCHGRKTIGCEDTHQDDGVPLLIFCVKRDTEAHALDAALAYIQEHP